MNATHSHAPDDTQSERERVLLHMPVDVRSVSLAVIAVIVSLYAMQWAKPVLVPILFGLMLSQALTPLVNLLGRWRVPRALSAALLLMAIAGGLVWAAMALNSQANELVKMLPQVSHRIRQLVRGSSGSIGMIDQVQRAANELQGTARPQRPGPKANTDGAAASDAASASASAQGGTDAAGGDAAAGSASSPANDGATVAGSAFSATASSGDSGSTAATDTTAQTASTATTARTGATAKIGSANGSHKAAAPASQPAPANTTASKPAPDIQGYLLTGTMGALDVLGQVAIAFFVALFLMSAGDSFRRKMVRLAGPTLTQKKITVETMNEITAHVQRYMLVQVAVSVLVGIATGLAFFALGLHQPAVWGVVAGVTNLIPYVGAILIGAGSAVVAMVQFGNMQMALIVGGVSFGIHSLVGNVLTPWWMGRASSMSAFAVFVAVLLFGWLWGVSGLLLGVPILMALKSICDRVDELKPIGELLSA